jgi:hypothetical protein
MVDLMKVFLYRQTRKISRPPLVISASQALVVRHWFAFLNRQSGFPDLSIQALPSLHLLMC